MGDKDIRIGVIGMGAIGPSHVHGIEQVDGCRLSAVCDIRQEVAMPAAKDYGVAAFADVAAMLASGEVDAVTVSTPSGFHRDAVIASLAHNIPVLCEKPLEITIARIDEIIEAEKNSDAFVAGVYQSRFGPIVRKMKSLIDGGMIGDIYSGGVHIKHYRTQEYYDSGDWRGTWKVDGGGCLMNQGIHEIDLFRWFLGAPTEVIAMTETKGRNIEVETLALALVRFQSGAAGVIQATTLAYPEYQPHLEFVGSKGTVAFSSDRLIHMDLMDPSAEEAAARQELLQLTRQHEEAAARRPKVAPGTAVATLDMGHTPVIEDFVGAIRTGEPPFVTATESRKAVALISAIYESSRGDSCVVALKEPRTGYAGAIA